MIKTNTIMTMEHFHDFYYLQAIHAGIITELSRKPELVWSKTVEKLQQDIQYAMDEIIPNIAFRTFVYLYAACLGEARHANSDSAERVFLPSTSKSHRKDLFDNVWKFEPNSANLKALINVFSQSWLGGFGGEAWLGIAKALPMYFTMPPSAFIDHVIDLEHNNGTAFSKYDSKDSIYFQCGYDGFKNFLDYKFRYDILVQPYSSLRVTRQVYKLINRYATIFRKTIPLWIYPELPALTDYEVEWGKNTLELCEKWHVWTDVRAGNKPTAEYLYYLSNIDDVYPPSLTLKEVKHEWKNAKARAKEIGGQFITPYIKRKLNKRFKRWLEWAQVHCRMDKLKTTYPVLPCKVKVYRKYIKLQFPVKFQGIGQKTDYGFSYEIQKSIPGIALTKSEKGFDGTSRWSDGHFEIHSGMNYITLHTNGYAIPSNDKKLEAILD